MTNVFNIFNPLVANNARPNDQDRFDCNNDACDLAGRIFQIVNEYRTSIKKPALIFLSSMSALAQRHSKYLAEHDIRDGDWAHVDWSAKTPSSGTRRNTIDRHDEILQLPQRFSAAAENNGTGDLATAQLELLAYHPEIAEIFLREWLASTKGHRETIEDNYTHSGIAVTIRPMPEAGDRSLIFVTQHFAK
ncbi:CAP domain-containing protein [Microcoleus sp. herbarium7]|uniref:CAP domain-containing protein n=1 Tax=Microcoleus sp. herbarium7 TaxID=3055435 RepID=UPI002FCFEB8A